VDRKRNGTGVLSLALAAVALLQPLSAHAWGNTGHKLVARVAEAYLTPAARAQITSLLSGDPAGKTLPGVAVWADKIKEAPRDGLKNTRQWHFVDIPRKETNYDAARDCKASDEGDCVIQAIDRERTVLADTHASASDRRDALKFIVHLVGDLHQPLHCSNDNDRGGNDEPCSFNGLVTNLHSVWDTDIINAAALADHLTDIAYAKRLVKSLPADVSTIQSGSTTDWALEAHRLADTNAYDIPPATGSPKLHRLKHAYLTKNRPVVEAQLAKAGARLAGILNAALK